MRAENEKKRLQSWPTTHVGTGTETFSFASNIGVDGVTSTLGYTYSINFSHIDCTTHIVDENINDYRWDFEYSSGSKVAKNSSSLEVGSRYRNKTGNFTLLVKSSVHCKDNYNIGKYRFSLSDISVK